MHRDKRINALYVAGKFNDSGGRHSRLGEEIFLAITSSSKLRDLNCIEPEYHYLNGGNFSELEDILDVINDYNLIYWFADAPNEKPKLINEIKKRNNECVLVTSKRNVEKHYELRDLVYHALGIKSNLFMEITKNLDSYQARIIDPLGNVFLDYQSDFSLAGRVLNKRATEILSYSRIPSVKVGGKIEAPDDEEFFSIIRNYAEVYHSLIHASPEATNRFLGNSSFRCENGFPSFKGIDYIFVSKRNIDKRFINKDAFVCVNPGKSPVEYFGDEKPSVDTPIQVKLYDYYPKVRFMLHSHVYINGAQFTKHVIPCGALEEFDDIIKVYPDNDASNFFVNLKGHGSLALVSDLNKLGNLPYVTRNWPEVHDYVL